MKNEELRMKNCDVTEFSSSWEEEYPKGEVVGKSVNL